MRDTFAVAEIRDPFIRHLHDADPSPHDPAGVEAPINTAGGGVERIDDASLAAHEDASSHHSGLPYGSRVAGESDGPLDLQLGNVFGCETGLCLVTRVGRLHAPAIPIASAGRECLGVSRTAACVGIGGHDRDGEYGQQECAHEHMIEDL